MSEDKVIKIRFEGQEFEGCLGTRDGISYYPVNLQEMLDERGAEFLGLTSKSNILSEEQQDNSETEQEAQEEDTQTTSSQEEPEKQEEQQEQTTENEEESEIEQGASATSEQEETDTEDGIQYDDAEETVVDEDRFDKPSEVLNNIDEMIFSQLNTEIDVDADLSNPTVALMYAQQKSTLATLLIVLGKAREDDKVKVREQYKRYLDSEFYQEHKEELEMLLANANENISVAKQIEATKQILIDEYRTEKDKYLEEVYQRASREFDDLNLPSLQDRMDDEENRQKSRLREGNIEAGFIADVLNQSALEEFAKMESTPDFVVGMLRFLKTKEEYAEYIKQAEMLQPQQTIYTTPAVEPIVKTEDVPATSESNNSDKEVSEEDLVTKTAPNIADTDEEADEAKTEESSTDDEDIEEDVSTDEESSEEDTEEDEEEEKSDDSDDDDDDDSDDDDSDKEDKSKDSKKGGFLDTIGLGSLFGAKKGRKKSKSEDDDDDDDELEDLDDIDEEPEEIIEEKPKNKKGKGENKKKLPVIPIVASVLTVATIGGGVWWYTSLNDTNGNSSQTQQTSSSSSATSDSTGDSASSESTTSESSTEQYTAENHYGFKVGDSVDVTVDGTEANATITEFDKDGNALAMTSGGNTVLIQSDTLKSARESKTGVFKD